MFQPSVRARLIVLALLALVLVAGVAPAGAQAPERPNVLVLMTDDQTADSLAVMPNVQQLLMAQGTTFDRSFVNFSLCCPSRATYLTGQYTHNHGVRGLAPPIGGYTRLDASNYLPQWMREAGYLTAHLGKYLNGYGLNNLDPREVPSGFDDWHGSIDPTTYEFFHYTLNDNGRLNAHGTGGPPPVYQTDFYASRASELITDYAASGRPFYFTVAFVGPHHGGPREVDDPGAIRTPAVAPRHRDQFAGVPLPQPPNFNEADVSDKPATIRRRPPFTPERIAQIQEAYQQRLESLMSVDDAVGQIMSTLERTGELQNTLVIFTSDNGFLHGEHRVGFGKVYLYEPSIRVPLIMRGPGVPAGQRRRQLVTNADLSPTILDATGARAGKPQDGRSLFPLLRDRALEWGRDVLIYGRNPRYNAIRTYRYVYARHASGETELYDLRRDPFELNNLNADPRYRLVRNELSRRLRTLAACVGPDCYAGPRLSLRLRARAGCVPAPVRVRLEGLDRRLVARTAYFVRGRRTAQARGPRAVADRLLHGAPVPRGRRFRLRARVSLRDGRVVTLDRRPRACRAG
ncbi:MAG TPA: sulfatase [Thermoleophilaceae bacterium]|nr:sulfatase [Thermoleophilaceae bacterium]